MVLLDASGSMRSSQGYIIEGFNTLLQDQKAKPEQCDFTLAQFSSAGTFKYMIERTPIQDVPELTNDKYVIGGMTALNDSLGRVIDETGRKLAALPEEERPSGVMIVVLTDGEENDSREYSAKQIADMIKHQTETYNWNFIYIGANQDSKKVAQSRGITDSFNYSTSKDSIGATFSNISGAVASFRSSGGIGNKFKSSLINVTDEDLQKLGSINLKNTNKVEPNTTTQND